MKLNQLFADDDAVSPVIGVILMVAITVILAGVIATFVLGLGDQVGNTAPQASFTFEWSDSGSGEGPLEVTHDGGETIQAQNLYIRGSDGSAGSATPVPGFDDSWDAYADGVSGDSKVQAGMSASIDNVDIDGEARIVWQSSAGDTSSTLKEWTGPDA